MKICTKCGEEKPLEGFDRDSRLRDGREAQCKTCRAAQKKARLERDPAAKKAKREAVRRWRKKNPERHAEAQRRDYANWKSRNPGAPAAKARETSRRQQQATVDRAVNRGKEWTGPELELIADRSRGVVEVALALGRTATAVKEMRRQIYLDPRKARMAGTDVQR